MNAFEALLRRVMTLLDERHQKWALVGGLAVSVRTEPRFTRDLDLVVAVSDDLSAEGLIYQLHGTGFHTFATVEHEVTKRLATARLSPGNTMHEGLVLDLLFAVHVRCGLFECMARNERLFKQFVAFNLMAGDY